jgi:hypothetical protein
MSDIIVYTMPTHDYTVIISNGEVMCVSPHEATMLITDDGEENLKTRWLEIAAGKGTTSHHWKRIV